MFVRKDDLWLMKNVLTNPYGLFSIFFSIAMSTGIMIVYFTTPKQLSMFFFFHIVVIEYNKDQKMKSFSHKCSGCVVKKLNPFFHSRSSRSKRDYKTRIKLFALLSL